MWRLPGRTWHPHAPPLLRQIAPRFYAPRALAAARRARTSSCAFFGGFRGRLMLACLYCGFESPKGGGVFF